jgi:hypothetical protein
VGPSAAYNHDICCCVCHLILNYALDTSINLSIAYHWQALKPWPLNVEPQRNIKVRSMLDPGTSPEHRFRYPLYNWTLEYES